MENVNEGEYVMPPMLPSHGDPSCCDACIVSGKRVQLIIREDDTKEVIVKRQEIYFAQMDDVLSYYDLKSVVSRFEPKKGVADYP